MKSFSVKALVLALVVAAGSVQAYPGEGYVAKASAKLFGKKTTFVEINDKLVKLEKAESQFPGVDFSKADKTVRYKGDGYVNTIDNAFFGKINTGLSLDTLGNVEGGIPGLRNIRPANGYVRAIIVAGVVTGAAVAVRAAYKKYVAKPAVEAEENAEANVEAAQ